MKTKQKPDENIYLLYWNFHKLSCLEVFFYEWKKWKNSTIKLIKSKSQSRTYFFQMSWKVTKIYIPFHRTIYFKKDTIKKFFMKLLEKRVTRKEKNQFKNVFECCKVHLHYNDIVLHLSNKIKISGLKTIFRIRMFLNAA